MPVPRMRSAARVVRCAPRSALGERRRDVARQPRAVVQAAPPAGARALLPRDRGGPTGVPAAGRDVAARRAFALIPERRPVHLGRARTVPCSAKNRLGLPPYTGRIVNRFRVDLRSDTVTPPSAAMRRAMAEA